MRPDILESLYHEHYGPAMLYCITLCGDEALAQNLTAEAFVKAYLSLPDRIPSFRWRISPAYISKIFGLVYDTQI